MKTGKPTDNPVPWENPIPGDHPAFIPLEKEEAEKLVLAAIEEARRFADGPAAGLMSQKQRFLVDAERRRAHHEANSVVMTGETVQGHLRAWADALIDLGRFTEASLVCPDVAEYAEIVKQACARLDTWDCGCERERVTVPHGKDQLVIDLDRRVARGFVCSPYHNDVVTLYQCRHCGEANAMLDPPDRQANREIDQKRIEADTRRAIATGTAPMVPASDTTFLKSSSLE